MDVPTSTTHPSIHPQPFSHTTYHHTKGVQIATGVSLLDTYGMLAAYGAGLDFCVGAGVMVHTGAAINQYSGPFASVGDVRGALNWFGLRTQHASREGHKEAFRIHPSHPRPSTADIQTGHGRRPGLCGCRHLRLHREPHALHRYHYPGGGHRTFARCAHRSTD